MVAKGLEALNLDNPRVTQPLRALLSLAISRKVKGVVFSVPTTVQGKVLFNLVRHVLELPRSLEEAASIDLQRLQMASQLIAMVRPDPLPSHVPSD